MIGLVITAWKQEGCLIDKKGILKFAFMWILACDRQMPASDGI